MNIADLLALFPGEGHQRTIDSGALQQVWRFDVAVVNQRGQCLGHLDRRCRPVALADAHRNGVSLIPGFFIAFEFPVAGRHQAGTFFGQIDTGIIAVTELGQPGRQAIDTHVVGYLIEEGIR
ncbi:hypothetical protein D3C73_1391480 [compost metagenome]